MPTRRGISLVRIDSVHTMFACASLVDEMTPPRGHSRQTAAKKLQPTDERIWGARSEFVREATREPADRPVSVSE